MRALVTKITGGLFIVGLVTAGLVPQAASATSYPSWDDVVAARANQADKEAEVTRVTDLLNQLESQLQAATAEANKRGEVYGAAREKFEAADQRTTELKAQADAARKKADEAKTLAGRLGAQLYRSGGGDLGLNMMVDGGTGDASTLLSRLGSMSKLMERSSEIYADALAAENEAKALEEQAQIALTERERLKVIAEDAYNQAVEAQKVVASQVAENKDHADVLRAQLAALNAAADATVADYERGVEIARQAALEQARKDAEERGVPISDAGWTKPGDGWVSDNYGPRTPIWTGGGWTNSWHSGTDYAQGCGSGIYAASGGTVVFAGWNGGLGYHIRIDHGGGIESSYSHIMEGGIDVSWGQYVSPGQRIASTGSTGQSTGCHLHFMITIWGSTTDPREFLRSKGVDT